MAAIDTGCFSLARNQVDFKEATGIVCQHACPKLNVNRLLVQTRPAWCQHAITVKPRDKIVGGLRCADHFIFSERIDMRLLKFQVQSLPFLPIGTPTPLFAINGGGFLGTLNPGANAGFSGALSGSKLVANNVTKLGTVI